MVMFCGWIWIVLASPAQVDVPIQVAEQRPTAVLGEAVSPLSSDDNGAADDDAGEQSLETFSLPAGTVFRRVVVGADGSVTETTGDTGGVAGEGERLIYSNTLGINAVAIGNGLLLSDDITTTAPDGCNLKRFRFKVMGKVNSSGAGGPYTVRYALYDTCPQSVPSAMRLRDVGHPQGGIRIPGTSGELTFPDDEPRLIEVTIAEPNVVPIPTNVWLGLQFLRSNCGTVVGAPAMVGHSADIWDQTGAPACGGFLGGFPEQPYAGVWTEVYGGVNCSQSFVGYRASNAAGPQINPAPGRFFMDDLLLTADNCQMIGYEVAVRAPSSGFFEIELRQECQGPAIPGTYGTLRINLNSQPKLQLARFSFDPPIPLDSPELYVAVKVNVSTSGVVLAGENLTIGASSDHLYFVSDYDNSCHEAYPYIIPPTAGRFHVSIICAGTQPAGACCDPYLTECVGGPDAGKRCQCNAMCVGGANNGLCCSPSMPCAAPGVCTRQCAEPGTCEAVCREVPKDNCPFPPGGQNLAPKWVEGQTCSPDVFGAMPCGVGTCCYGGFNPVTSHLEDHCDNLTRSECEVISPLELPRIWQLAAVCGEAGQTCPKIACLSREQSCDVQHDGPGCGGSFCCSQVCEFDDWCCHVEWDDICLRWVAETCARYSSMNECYNSSYQKAYLLDVNTTTVFTNSHATEKPSDPGFCCHNGVGKCNGGDLMDQPCLGDADCPDGVCEWLGPVSGAKGYGTVWFKFTATHTSARVDTCRSTGLDPTSSDSLLQVFAVRDPTSDQTACNSLIPIACNDDAGSACPDAHNASVCASGLVPGDTYYVLVASKTSRTKGRYRITVTSGCDGESLPEACLPVCPGGAITFVDPPSGVVDARRPFDPVDPSRSLGIQTLVATGPQGIPEECWAFCESNEKESQNAIESITEFPPGRYTFQLARPISTQSTTNIVYTNWRGEETIGWFASLPADVSGGGWASPTDILWLIDVLNGSSQPPWGLFSTDCDRSGVAGPADILCVIDLLNSGWIGARVTLGGGPCP